MTILHSPQTLQPSSSLSLSLSLFIPITSICLSPSSLHHHFHHKMNHTSLKGVAAARNAGLLAWRSFFGQPSQATPRLEGKIAVITGAAGGIGRAAAAAFVRNGAKVVVADIHRELGEGVAAELGPAASFVHCDVAKESDLSDAVDHAVSVHGKLDIMYNNAGIACKTAPSIVDLDLSTFDRIMAVNVRGMVAGIKHAARVMIPQQKGCILCTASVTSILGGLSQHTYCVSKSAIPGLVRSANAELSRHGIRVNCISPYGIPTPFVMEEMRLMYPGVDNSRLVKILHDTGELKGANCEEIDVANAALYLASDEAKYVSGHNLVVDGGFTVSKPLKLPTPDQLQ